MKSSHIARRRRSENTLIILRLYKNGRPNEIKLFSNQNDERDGEINQKLLQANQIYIRKKIVLLVQNKFSQLLKSDKKLLNYSKMITLELTTPCYLLKCFFYYYYYYFGLGPAEKITCRSHFIKSGLHLLFRPLDNKVQCGPDLPMR